MNTDTNNAETKSTIEVDGIVCFESEDNPGIWLYIPGAPQPEKVNGRPSLQLYASRESATLQLGAQWALSPEQYATLKKSVEAQVKSSDIDLQPAPASVQQCVVEYAGDKGQRTPLATARSSGFSPHTALFRIVLSNEGKMLATASLHGREGILFVRYHVSTRIKASARVSLSGDIARARETLNASSTQMEIRKWMDAALDTGTLRLEVVAGSEAGLVEAAVANTKEQFAAALQAELRRPETALNASSTLRIQASATGFRERELDREADISTWFPAGSGHDFITVV